MSPASYSTITINGVTLSPSTTVRLNSSQIPLGKVRGEYTFTATAKLDRGAWQKLCNLLDDPRIRSMWEDKPVWMWPLFKVHEGGGNARQRRKRLRAAYRESLRLRRATPEPTAGQEGGNGQTQKA